MWVPSSFLRHNDGTLSPTPSFPGCAVLQCGCLLTRFLVKVKDIIGIKQKQDKGGSYYDAGANNISSPREANCNEGNLVDLSFIYALVIFAEFS